MSLSGHALELVPLKEFILKKPLFLSNKDDTEVVASRCSALYLVLGSRAEGLTPSKEVQSVVKLYKEHAVTYENAREILSKESLLKALQSQNRQKDFAKHYASVTLADWKQGDDPFKGSVSNDLDVCADNYPYFKKLVVHVLR